METLRQIFAREFLSIPLWSYLAAFGALVGGLVLKRIVAAVVTRLLVISRRTRFVFDTLVLESIDRPAQWGALLAGVWTMFLVLPIPSDLAEIEKFVGVGLKGLSIGLIIWAGTRLSDGMCEWWAGIASRTETKLDDQIVPIVRRGAKVFLIIVGGMLVLQNLGYSIGSLLAGLGLGGAALALASKDTVANVFGSLVIFLDQPFQIGDWVEMGSIEGTVEEVGLRTTRVRTFANSLITVPNSLFTTNSVNNWSRMKKRRIKMTVGLTYGTSGEKMQAAVDRIRGIIANDERFAQDFYLVCFDGFGASSLDIFIYCFTVTTNWAEFLAVKQDFLLAIMKAVEELGLSFAFPTQSLHIESLPEGPKGAQAFLTRERPQ